MIKKLSGFMVSEKQNLLKNMTKLIHSPYTQADFGACVKNKLSLSFECSQEIVVSSVMNGFSYYVLFFALYS